MTLTKHTVTLKGTLIKFLQAYRIKKKKEYTAHHQKLQRGFFAILDKKKKKHYLLHVCLI